MGKFTHLDARLGTVSTTADADKAESYANRAPEATWEALWSVYALQRRELADEYYQSDEGHFWVLAQQMADPPVVIEAQAPLAALRQWGHSAGKSAPEVLLGLAARGTSRGLHVAFQVNARMAGRDRAGQLHHRAACTYSGISARSLVHDRPTRGRPLGKMGQNREGRTWSDPMVAIRSGVV
jgi:hypothetical protein